MQRVLFLIPPYFSVKDYLNQKQATSALLPAFTIPYGILSIHAFLKKNVIGGIEIDLLDLNIAAHKILKR